MELWDKKLPVKVRKHVSSERLWFTIYSRFVEKLKYRRVGRFSLEKGKFEDIIPSPSAEYDQQFDISGLKNMVPSKSLIALPPSAKHLSAAKVKAERAFRYGIPIEAIAYSSSSENMYRELEVRTLPLKVQFKYNTNLISQFR